MKTKTKRPQPARTTRKRNPHWQRKDKQDWNGFAHGQMWRRYKERYA